MVNTLIDREAFINDMMVFLNSKYDLNDTQIFVFGSFLSDDFVPGKSDIDIGVYSEDETKMYDIECDLGKYLDRYNLKHDIVIMHLNINLWINIPIMTYGKQLTDYESEHLFNYLLNMVQRWGFNPLDKIKEAV